MGFIWRKGNSLCFICELSFQYFRKIINILFIWKENMWLIATRWATRGGPDQSPFSPLISFWISINVCFKIGSKMWYFFLANLRINSCWDLQQIFMLFTHHFSWLCIEILGFSERKNVKQSLWTFTKSGILMMCCATTDSGFNDSHLVGSEHHCSEKQQCTVT